MNREKTLHDLEDVSKRVAEEGEQLRSELSRKFGGSLLLKGRYDDDVDQTDDRFDHAEDVSPFAPSMASVTSSQRDLRAPEASRPEEAPTSDVPPPSSAKQSRATSFLDFGADKNLNLDAGGGEKIAKAANDKNVLNTGILCDAVVAGENSGENLSKALSSNPSTPRNIKEAYQRSSAIGE